MKVKSLSNDEIFEMQIRVSKEEIEIFRQILTEFLQRRNLPITPYAQFGTVQQIIAERIKSHYKRLDMSGMEEMIINMSLAVRIIYRFLRTTDHLLGKEGV